MLFSFATAVLYFIWISFIVLPFGIARLSIMLVPLQGPNRPLFLWRRKWLARLPLSQTKYFYRPALLAQRPISLTGLSRF